MGTRIVEGQQRVFTTCADFGRDAAYDFGHVEDDNSRHEANTDTGNQTASNDETKAMAGDLENATNDVDTAASDDSGASTNSVGQITGDDGTEESTGRQNGDDKGVVGPGECLLAWAFDGLDEDLGAGDTVDVSRVVAEEDAAKGGEGAEQVGLPGDRGLDALDVGCGAETTCTFARHAGSFLGGRGSNHRDGDRSGGGKR